MHTLWINYKLVLTVQQMFPLRQQTDMCSVLYREQSTDNKDLLCIHFKPLPQPQPIIVVLLLTYST